MLGHKDDMPGSGQWIETSVENSPAEHLSDWLSNKNIYTLVFWSKKFGHQVQSESQYSEKEISFITKLLKNPDYEKIKYNTKNMRNSLGPMPFVVGGEVVEPQENFECPPLMAGSFNKWQYSQMYKINDLIRILDKNYVSPIAETIEKVNAKETVKNATEFTKTEFKQYVTIRLRSEKKMKSNWLSILM